MTMKKFFLVLRRVNRYVRTVVFLIVLIPILFVAGANGAYAFMYYAGTSQTDSASPVLWRYDSNSEDLCVELHMSPQPEYVLPGLMLQLLVDDTPILLHNTHVSISRVDSIVLDTFYSTDIICAQHNLKPGIYGSVNGNLKETGGFCHAL